MPGEATSVSNGSSHLLPFLTHTLPGLSEALARLHFQGAGVKGCKEKWETCRGEI